MNDKTRQQETGGLTYRDSGVDIDAGNQLVARIKNKVKATRRPEVLSGLGGFAGLCGLPGRYRDPVMVACTDGVGTKLKLAFQTGIHNTIGQDLVAMSVNDLVVCGAEPLFFLDYFACGHLDVGVAESVVGGIADACKAVNCALLGGETAELPSLYADGEYDLAGFCVGVVERDARVEGADLEAGDVLLGLGASGFHSNGYSLVRRVFLEHAGLSLDAELEGVAKPLGEALLEPTALYVRAVHALYKSDLLHGAAHITGGGLVENPPRMVPQDAPLKLRIHTKAWTPPALFGHLARLGNVAPDEMRRTFNMGIGMLVAVPADAVDQAVAIVEDAGHAVFNLGEVVASPDGPGTVEFVG